MKGGDDIPEKRKYLLLTSIKRKTKTFIRFKTHTSLIYTTLQLN